MPLLELHVQQVTDVVDVVGHVLRDDLVGAYLHGSAVLGGLRPYSDVDVFVVTRRSTTPQQRRALVERLLEISGSRASRGPARPVELIVVVETDVRPWRYPPMMEFLYGEWLRDDYERGETPSPMTSPDLAPLITMVRNGDTPLVGPPPAAILDPVPDDDLRRAIVAGVPDLLDEVESDTRNVVLTLSRIWSTLATGTIKSKDGAADWTLPLLPADHQRVLARARAIYLGDEQERWDDLAAEIRPHCEYVIGHIRRLFTGS